MLRGLRLQGATREDGSGDQLHHPGLPEGVSILHQPLGIREPLGCYLLPHGQRQPWLEVEGDEELAGRLVWGQL